MPNDETKTIPPVKIGPEDLERILRKFEEELLKEERLRKGDDSFLKTSSIDKPIDQPDLRQQFILRVAENINSGDYVPRIRLKDGGDLDPIDAEILELEMFVGLRPGNSMEAFYIENMKDRLEELYKQKSKNQK
jgi:hypothetical protein